MFRERRVKGPAGHLDRVFICKRGHFHMPLALHRLLGSRFFRWGFVEVGEVCKRGGTGADRQLRGSGEGVEGGFEQLY